MERRDVRSRDRRDRRGVGLELATGSRRGRGAATSVSVVRIPIPATPERLLDIAARLDRFWLAVEASGHVKPTLAQELEQLERWSREPR